ncbi:hypothetical protein [Thioalkalivibrio sp. XN8]|uniref:O-antigen ligase family protein n=1 Tax=Thioalkalivibrio sp. XN8 TaxID=2712863 RepID=UPI0013EB75BD|nr:hypothetical protein [Thioalkalivibrio sp. XN8]NGP53703.1 hypothetical protein [Thioalkalivibrio sp. XN8]
MFALFRMLPVPKALILSVLSGYLLLPSRTVVDLPLVPPLDKASVISLVALLLTQRMSLAHRDARRSSIRSLRSQSMKAGLQAEGASFNGVPLGRPGTRLFFVFLLAVVLSPFLTVFRNGDGVTAGPRIISGLSLYDGLSMSINLFIAVIPFILGLRFVATRDEHRYLVTALAVAGVVYSFFVLFEFRMSPRLHIWIYGFFQHDWVQHIRGGGFRPIVFLEHGLAVGLFLATALLASSGQFRVRATAGLAKGPWVVGGIWIALALLLSRNLAAVVLVMVFVPAVLLLSVRNQLLLAAFVAVTFLSFPLLRGVGLVPIETIISAAEIVDERRAASLRFRLYHEDALLERALEKPLSGWGGWGRNRLYDEVSGRDLSVTDGAWIIVIGTYGWIGYIAQFGLVALPLILLWRQQRRQQDPFDPATAALAMIIALSLLYMIPNDFRNPIFWLVAGALAGRCQIALTEKRVLPTRRNSARPSRLPTRQPRPT